MQATNNSVKLHDFPESPAEERKEEDSSIFPLSRDQLLKEHQDYWLEIVRMEEEMEILKAELENAKEAKRRLELQGLSSKE